MANQDDEGLSVIWNKLTLLEKTGMVAIGTATALASLWVFSPNFRAGIKAAVAITTGNSAAQDLYASWQQNMVKPMVQYGQQQVKARTV